MAGDQPPDQAFDPDTSSQKPIKTFAQALANKVSGCDKIPDYGTHGLFRGEPALNISRKELLHLSQPFKNALVGRFPYSRPSLEIIRRFITALGLKGDCPIGLLDNRHILIRPSVEEDFTRLWTRRTWFIQNAPMVVSKWTIDFNPNQEASLAPVWVEFPHVPLPLFNMKYIQKLAALLGRPLQVDSATVDLRRPSVARVLIEMDVAVEPPKRIWIGDDNEGSWLQVNYERWPEYCEFCKRVGHLEEVCFRKDPSLKPEKSEKQQPAPQKDNKKTFRQVYQSKKKVEEPASAQKHIEQVNQMLQQSRRDGDDSSLLINANAFQDKNISMEVLPSITALDEVQTLCDNTKESDGKGLHNTESSKDVFSDIQSQVGEDVVDVNKLVDDSINAAASRIIETIADRVIQEEELVDDEGSQVQIQLAKEPRISEQEMAKRGIETSHALPSLQIQSHRAPQKPHFKDVFEEIKWEKLHNKITYVQPQQSKSFLGDDYSSVSQTTNDDNNEEEEHSQSDRDQDVDDDQFIQVISKKAKKRKQYSKTGKTMQTRQYLKSKNQAPSRYHKCGAC